MPAVGALSDQVESWPVGRAAAAVIAPGQVLETLGDSTWTVRIASVSKLIAAFAVLVGLEEETLDIEESAGPPGSTVRHLLAHASGLLFDQHRTVTAPGRRRIYSNAGIEQLADHLAERAGMPFAEYQRHAVLEPLGMTATFLRGSPAHDVWSNTDDLARLALELLTPTLISADTFRAATSVQFPELRGGVPGLGSFDPNPWGLGFEIRGDKSPHWTGFLNSPSTYGHFGGTGTFLWVDPEHQVAALALTDRQFGEWSLAAWPAFSDEVIRSYTQTG